MCFFRSFVFFRALQFLVVLLLFRKRSFCNCIYIVCMFYQIFPQNNIQSNRSTRHRSCQSRKMPDDATQTHHIAHKQIQLDYFQINYSSALVEITLKVVISYNLHSVWLRWYLCGQNSHQSLCTCKENKLDCVYCFTRFLCDVLNVTNEMFSVISCHFTS